MENKITKVEPYILKIWPKNQMAEIMQGDQCVFIGNFWDFHPGCHGTKMWINDKYVDIGRQWAGAHDLAYLLAAKAKSKVIVKEYKRKWK
jgi:hypothetical protein